MTPPAKSKPAAPQSVGEAIAAASAGGFDDGAPFTPGTAQVKPTDPLPAAPKPPLGETFVRARLDKGTKLAGKLGDKRLGTELRMTGDELDLIVPGLTIYANRVPALRMLLEGSVSLSMLFGFGLYAKRQADTIKDDDEPDAYVSPETTISDHAVFANKINAFADQPPLPSAAPSDAIEPLFAASGEVDTEAPPLVFSGPTTTEAVAWVDQ